MRELAMRNYWPGDAALMALREESACELGITADDFDGGAAPEGVARTIVRAGRPILAAGICPIWAGRRYLAWVIASALERAEWGYAVRAIRVELERHSAPRIEADCRADFPTGLHFLQRLGFAREGVMQRYDGERDFVRFARAGGQYGGET